jgi:predicted nucleic acid-binding protein
VNLVFDSSALIAYLHDEAGAGITDELLLDKRNACFVHAVNLCEVYYEARRRGGEETAQATLLVLRRTGLIAREDLDEDLWQRAGQIKADYRRVSLADCFCITLANRLAAEVVTCDKHELGALAEAGECKVRFIR